MQESMKNGEMVTDLNRPISSKKKSADMDATEKVGSVMSQQ
jgi:hypothetical protein